MAVRISRKTADRLTRFIDSLNSKNPLPHPIPTATSSQTTNPPSPKKTPADYSAGALTRQCCQAQKFSFKATCICRAEVVASGREAVDVICPKIEVPSRLPLVP